MNRSHKAFLGFAFVATVNLLGISVVDAAFKRGGDKTYYEIAACKDGITVFLGTEKHFDTPPEASIRQIRRVAGDVVLLGAVPLTWTLDSGPLDILDANSDRLPDESVVSLSVTGTRTFKWSDKVRLQSGSHIWVDGVDITDIHEEIVEPFEAIIGNCLTTDPPNMRTARVFIQYYGFDADSGAISIAPDKSVLSTISVISGTSHLAFGDVVTDIDVSMHFSAYAPEVYLTSPSGRTIRLFQNVASETYGTRLSSNKNQLTRDLMGNFVLDDDSEFDFNLTASPFVSEAIRPDQPLSLFSGEDPHGTWTLTIHNTSLTDWGEFAGWALEVEVAEPGLPTSFQNGVMPSTAYASTQDAEIDESASSHSDTGTEICHVDGNIANDLSDKDQNALLRWDLSAIPEGSHVSEVTLELNVVNPTQGPYTLWGMRRAWDERAVSWNRATADSDWQVPGVQGDQDRDPNPIGIISSVDVGWQRIALNAAGVAMVQRWIDQPELNFGLMIADSNTSDGLDFSCRENAIPANRPRLNVKYTPPPPQNFQFGVAPTAGYGGAQDAEIDETAPDQNLASSRICHTDGDKANDNASKVQNVLLRWDVGSIPTASLIVSATLTLNVVNPSQGPYDVYPLNREWNRSEVTWSQAGSGEAWQVPGAQGAQDRSNVPIATVTNVKTGQLQIPLNAAGIARVQEWVTRPERNFGMVITGPATADGLDFDCSESLATASRPRLEVGYLFSDYSLYLSAVQRSSNSD